MTTKTQPQLRPGRIIVLPNGTHAIELMFRGANGEGRSGLFEFGELNDARAVNRKLRNAGYTGIPLNRIQAAQLDAQVGTYAQSPRGQRATCHADLPNGWSADCTRFVYGDRELPFNRKLPRLRAPREGDPGAAAGTLAGWQRHVAGPAAYSSRAVLMIAAALAAPTLVFQGYAAGGFGINIFGKSTRGKTTALRVAASLSASTILSSWNGTALAFQELAQDLSDLPITIDAMEAVAADAPAELTDAVAYTVAEGRPRSRTRAWSLKNSVNERSWRTILLSTAETAQPRGRRTGAAVRLMYVPANVHPESPLGIFDGLPETIADNRLAASAKTLADRLKAATARHYGHAMPAFIGHLVENRNTVAQTLATYRAAFLSGFADGGYTAVEQRALDQFAVCYAAGRLAIDAKILPWDAAVLLEALQVCARDALDQSPDQGRRNAEIAKRIAHWLADKSRRWLKYDPALTEAQLLAADGVMGRLNASGEQVRVALILPDTLMRALHLTKREVYGAMWHLHAQGLVVTEARADTPTKQFKFADCGPRFFVLRRDVPSRQTTTTSKAS